MTKKSHWKFWRWTAGTSRSSAGSTQQSEGPREPRTPPLCCFVCRSAHNFLGIEWRGLAPHVKRAAKFTRDDDGRMPLAPSYNAFAPRSFGQEGRPMHRDSAVKDLCVENVVRFTFWLQS